jgi:hypothetical protein
MGSQVLNGLPQHVKVVDLSADFRLRSTESYAEWYGGAHMAPELQKEAVYGLTEHYREEIASARLVANPGCYPTSALLPLLPLIRAELISKEGITIDSKSGVSGAGRSAKEANLFCEVADGMHAYGVGKHRHMPEIEQELSAAADSPITVSFTPHLIPMSRGMQSTIYVTLAAGQTADSLRAALVKQYQEEFFVRCGWTSLAAANSSDSHCSFTALSSRVCVRYHALEHTLAWQLPPIQAQVHAMQCACLMGRQPLLSGPGVGHAGCLRRAKFHRPGTCAGQISTSSLYLKTACLAGQLFSLSSTTSARELLVRQCRIST